MAEGSLSIELERGVGLGEMIVAADLDWPVAGVGNLNHDSRPVLVQDNLTCRRDDLAWDHCNPPPEIKRVAVLSRFVHSLAILSTWRRIHSPTAMPAQ